MTAQAPYAPAPSLVPSQEERVLAGICHLSPFVGVPIVAPVAIYFIKKDSRFVGFHALQAIFLHIAAIPLLVIAYVMAFALTIGMAASTVHTHGPAALIGTGLVFLVALATPTSLLFLITVYAAYRGFMGNAWRIPLLGRIAENIVDAPKSVRQPTPPTG